MSLPFLRTAELEGTALVAADPNGQPAFEVKGGAAQTTTTVVNCPAPTIETNQYVVRGSVKYDAIVGEGYLELWSDFGDKGKFFTRSLSDWGALRKLKGTSSWREFELPFRADSGMHPKNLTLNVVLPSTGTVVVSQPIFVPVDTASEWWTNQQAGLYGGVMGSCLGVLGAIVGCLAGLKKARSITLGLFVAGLSASGVCLLMGLIAVVFRQPWHVYYPLLLIGVIGVGVLGGNLWNLLHRYRNDELRHMAAVNA